MIWAIVLLCIFALALLILFLHSIKFCTGGLLGGCGRLLFPWNHKVFIDGNFCCEACLKRDLELFKESDLDSALKFMTMEEEQSEDS